MLLVMSLAFTRWCFKNPETYEIMTPQLVGISKNDLPLGKLSGKHAFAEKLKSLGYDIEPQNQAELFKTIQSHC